MTDKSPLPDSPETADCPSAPCCDYVVTGYVLVPHKVEMIIDAESPRRAMNEAKRIFDRTPGRHQWIEGNSEDLASCFDFEPSCAEPQIRHNVQADLPPNG